MKLVFRSGGVAMDRLLLVESGSRTVAEKFLGHVYELHPAERVDVLTCYSGEPANFDGARGQVISIHTAQRHRMELISSLAGNGYNVVAILCSNEAIMTPWKWAVSARLPAKLLIVNENADYFWFDTGHVSNLGALIRDRWGIGINLQLVSQVMVSPFVYLYLLANAAWVHARRALRRM